MGGRGQKPIRFYVQQASYDVGKELAVHTVASACQVLGGLTKTLASDAGKSGLTGAEAAQLQAGRATIAAKLGCS